MRQPKAVQVPRSLRHDVTEEVLAAIATAVDEAESRTSGEVHVHILHDLPLFRKAKPWAMRTFQRLGMTKTQQRNGVLLFVVMKPRAFEIVADEAIDTKVDGDTWEKVAALISETIGREGFVRGVTAGVAAIGAILAEHYPRDPEGSHLNELPNRPSVS